MRDESIAKNYADALLTLAQNAKDPAGWGAMIADVAAAIGREPKLRLFLDSPRVSVAEKNEILSKAFQDRLPRLLVRFLQILVANRRQNLIPEISSAYDDLLNAAENRVHADVTVARPWTPAEEKAWTKQMSAAVGKTVVPRIHIDSGIMGGIVIRFGDTIMDGSVRRRLSLLRQRLAPR
jgi:F-type H+-transporting ATPase subunit delta